MLTNMDHFLEEAPKLDVKGMIIYRKGEKVFHYQPKPEARQNQYSITKSFTSTAVAFAVQEKLFSLEDYVLDHFSEDAPEEQSEYLKEMKLKHLLTMSMGFEEPMLMGDVRARMTEKDWVRYVLNANIVHTPGTVFQYNNAGPYLLGILIQKLSKKSLIEYLNPRLFAPLGIPTPSCEQDPQGNTFGAGGLVLGVSEIAKLGQLYLQKGNWQGKQLIEQAWFESAASPQVKVEDDGEFGSYYGYLFWIMDDQVYRADGKYGQYIVIAPKKQAVIAVNAMRIENEKDVLRLIMQHVYPML